MEPNANVREVLKAALDDPERRVREAAASGLDRLEEQLSGERLLARFDSQDLMGRVESVYGLAALRTPQARDALRRALEDASADVRAAAARALGEFCDRKLLEPLIGRLEDPEAVVRREALVALRGWEDPSVALFVETVLEDADPEVVREALETLAVVGGGHADRILPLTRHRDSTLRAAALRALPGSLPSEG